MRNFIARYNDKGVDKVIRFNGSRFDEAKATQLLEKNSIQNFFFFFEERDFADLPDGGLLIGGEVGFDITLERLMPFINAGRELVIDSGGGSLWEGLRIHDYIKAYAPDLVIGVLGMCASAATLPLAASKNRWASDNSRFVIHNPWGWAEGDADTMQIMADTLRAEENNLISIYSTLFGLSKDEVKPLMCDTPFHLARAKEIGLINFEKKSGEQTPPGEQTINKDEKMKDTEVKAELSKIERAMAGLKALFVSPKNMVLQDANGVELDFGADVTTEEQIVVGITGVMADGVTAEGDYVLPSGITLKITVGEIMEIVPVAATPDPAMVAENAALKEQVANLTKANEVLAASNLTISNKVTEISTKFTAFQNKFSADVVIPANTPPVGGASKQTFTYNGRKK